MNTETLLLMIRHGLTAAGGALVTKGIADNAGIEQAAGAFITLLGLAWSWWRKYARMKEGRAAGVIPMLLFLCAALALPGCATSNTAAYKTAGVLEATADKAMSAWAGYYQSAIVQPGAKIGELADRRAQIDGAYTRFRASMNMVYTARATYVDNTAGGNTQLQAALTTAAQLSTELLNLVNVFLPSNQKVAP